MLLFDGALGLIFLGVWIFCIIDVITTPEGQCRNLPKIAWLFIVILLVDIGSLAWLVGGRAWNGESRRPLAGAPAAPGRRPKATNPDDDEEFLASLRSRAEEQGRQAREAQHKDDPERPLEES
ncbi:MAG: PLD nuclease N-terminal domain-containing protein [Pseudonocardiales bacterium]|nr:PLD nuclease N-terminal domain-containing protein [Actinomycetota bacterium]